MPALQRTVREIANDLAEIDTARPNCLLPAAECRAVIAAAERLPELTTSDAAAGLARTMIGVYPRAEVMDPDTYVTAVAGTLAQYPPHVSQKVASPITGLPSKQKFLPRIAEVREACEEEHRRQKTIVLKAKWMLQEHEKRERERREAENFKPADPAKVDEMVKEITARLSANHGDAA